ncbi:hypothetical protein VOLCADRAFT_108182 [Volvox carteri f. nagariensis]|uniref:Uncharacterized protein n=1 Tax=Volvox carteri f. nagariensis TaxID=3068 RepID=D8UIS7_VOLCA|nr:uncharacterized protein VOLCADRAFT_108182 [Volvox carteri f. nagariensis]EFJ40371.1 hypothetical protein VOLCADRAFT_108182 [Volvox carteri f. nagariensis]|eukprot:XP_002958575.1 hypothetical protein VOLCADRAFT_108182 [Volvox carteri f. nagariensis]
MASDGALGVDVHGPDKYLPPIPHLCNPLGSLTDDGDNEIFQCDWEAQEQTNIFKLLGLDHLAANQKSTTLDMVKQWATDVGGGDCNSHDDSKGHLKAQPFWT